jgi:Uma2 family endonuclease
MATVTHTPATLDDLLKVKEKAELIDGRIVRSMASGELPSTVAFEIAIRLREYARAAGRGKAYPDGIGYALTAPLPGTNRQSFSPDASYYDGPAPPDRMKFIQGVPRLAVEVRSEGDYGPVADQELADKRTDYFLAGTQVVWDVDPLAETIAVYRPAVPTTPVVFRRGDVADAEPALPGWRLKVDDVFG